MSVDSDIRRLGQSARSAARLLAGLSSQQKRDMLLRMAEVVEQQQSQIQAENEEDLAAGRQAGLSSALLDRLELTDSRFSAMVAGIRNVAELPDPVGEEIEAMTHPAGMRISRRRVPIGVIGIIYESRPNVTADAAALCLRSGNAIILRGGREAIRANTAIANALRAGGAAAHLPDGAVQLIQTTDRAAVRALCQLDEYVDLIIPRGGEGLIRAVVDMSRVPVIKHNKGVCHTYVDVSADLEMASGICENAKCHRPGVCNAMETLLVHEQVVGDFLPNMCQRLTDLGVELRGDERARAVVPTMRAATTTDWDKEYLDLILSVGVVDDVDAAIAHITKYGSQHSDAIVAADEVAQEKFLSGVDSAAVYVNASTRFTDGAEFGMGAEIGISTDKLHARGPMGLRELTTYKFVVQGSGQIRA
jgi:glutamate-5-semialdehyde dehydrogenase